MISEAPLVSIITPSYNQGRYIEATIQSVLNQDYPRLEYLVVDGGSTDETLQVLKRYEAHLIWTSQRDRGQADAINRGFHKAKGEILGWLNSDDTYLPGAIRQVVQYFQTHPEVGMVYGEGYHVDAGSKILERYYTEPFDYQRLAEICFICQPTAFIRAEVFRTVGPLDLNLCYCLDYDYWIRVAKRFRIGYLDAYFANSRLHMNTKTLSKQVEFLEEILQTVKKHYGQVPLCWIHSYAHAYLSQKLMPFTQGIHRDGWASPHVRVFLRGEWSHETHLRLDGEASVHTGPLPLQVAVGDQVLYKTVIEGAAFSINEPIWRDGVLPKRSDGIEVNVYANKSFIPQEVGINDDARTLSYHVRHLSLVDGHRGELALYSHRRSWFFLVALPAIVLWKSFLINHRILDPELWKGTRQLLRFLKNLLVR